MHISDLRGRYHYHGLDLLEMQAVWMCLPSKGWNGSISSKCPKAAWKNDFKSKLIALTLSHMMGSLAEGDIRNSAYSQQSVQGQDGTDGTEQKGEVVEIAYYDTDEVIDENMWNVERKIQTARSSVSTADSPQNDNTDNSSDTSSSWSPSGADLSPTAIGTAKNAVSTVASMLQSRLTHASNREDETAAASTNSNELFRLSPQLSPILAAPDLKTPGPVSEEKRVPMSIHGFTTPSTRIRNRLLAAVNAFSVSTPNGANNDHAAAESLQNEANPTVNPSNHEDLLLSDDLLMMEPAVLEGKDKSNYATPAGRFSIGKYSRETHSASKSRQKPSRRLNCRSDAKAVTFSVTKQPQAPLPLSASKQGGHSNAKNKSSCLDDGDIAANDISSTCKLNRSYSEYLNWMDEDSGNNDVIVQEVVAVETSNVLKSIEPEIEHDKENSPNINIGIGAHSSSIKKAAAIKLKVSSTIKQHASPSRSPLSSNPRSALSIATPAVTATPTQPATVHTNTNLPSALKKKHPNTNNNNSASGKKKKSVMFSPIYANGLRTTPATTPSSVIGGTPGTHCSEIRSHIATINTAPHTATARVLSSLCSPAVEGMSLTPAISLNMQREFDVEVVSGQNNQNLTHMSGMSNLTRDSDDDTDYYCNSGSKPFKRINNSYFSRCCNDSATNVDDDDADDESPATSFLNYWNSPAGGFSNDQQAPIHKKNKLMNSGSTTATDRVAMDLLRGYYDLYNDSNSNVNSKKRQPIESMSSSPANNSYSSGSSGSASSIECWGVEDGNHVRATPTVRTLPVTASNTRSKKQPKTPNNNIGVDSDDETFDCTIASSPSMIDISHNRTNISNLSNMSDLSGVSKAADPKDKENTGEPITSPAFSDGHSAIKRKSSRYSWTGLWESFRSGRSVYQQLNSSSHKKSAAKKNSSTRKQKLSQAIQTLTPAEVQQIEARLESQIEAQIDAQIDAEIDNFVVPEELTPEGLANSTQREQLNIELPASDKCSEFDLEAIETGTAAGTNRSAIDTPSAGYSVDVNINNMASVMPSGAGNMSRNCYYYQGILPISAVKEFSLNTATTLTFEELARSSTDEVRANIESGVYVVNTQEANDLLMQLVEQIDFIQQPLELLMLLIDRLGADVNIVDELGCTPLHRLFAKPLLGRYLVSRGADILRKDTTGESVLQLCIEYGYAEDWLLAALQTLGKESIILSNPETAKEYIYQLVVLGGYGNKVRDLLTEKIVNITSAEALDMLDECRSRGEEAFASMREPVETFELLEELILAT
jgi:hypothetical protein